MLAGRLAAMGFVLIDVGGPELTARALAGRRNGLKKSGGSHLVRLAVGRSL